METKNKGSYLKLRLTYTITEDNSVYYDTAVPNGDGSLVWIVVTKRSKHETGDAARLYSNNDGTLSLLSTIYIEPPLFTCNWRFDI